ncbi:hypothetical protein Tco_0733711 [Tanacetum coccineum]
MKGLSESKTSKSNVRRIQAKDIVKEVEDHLKAYSSAGMDISSVDMMPTTSEPINTTTTSNVAQNVADENLPQLLDSRGGSHVINVPAFDKEDFTSWKVRFLVFLDGLEPYLLKNLEDGPFVPMSSLYTTENPLPKPLRLKFNAFKSLEGEKVNGTFTTLKCLLNDLENNGVTIPQADVNATFDSDSDVKEDQRSNNEFLADLNAEFHERALLANKKRFYKRQHGRMILEFVKNGLLIWHTIEENGVTRPRKYSELTHADAIQADSDVKATNIILQGLPTEIYALVSHHKVAKDLWERIQLLMHGTSLTKHERKL